MDHPATAQVDQCQTAANNFYAYALYAFGPQYTVLYPLYVAIVGSSMFTIIMIGVDLDVAVVHRHLHGRLPRHAIILFFVAVPMFLAPVWLLMMMIVAIRQGRPSPFATVHVLDLAFVFPMLIVTAVGLWREQPWSYAWTGPLLILAAAMMGSLVVSEGIAIAQPTPDPWPLSVAFTVIAVAAGFLTYNYLRSWILRKALSVA